MPKYSDYKFQKKLTGGVMGRTLLVKLIITGAYFVMKCVDYIDENDKMRADSEITQMRNLDSKFTVHLVETILHDLEMCIIMDYYSGGDMQVIRKQDFINSGVVRFEGFFENTIINRIIGVADASVVYGANKGIGDQYRDKSIRFNGIDGELFHIPKNACGKLNKFSNFQRVACEVNMNSSPRTAYFFVEGTEQPRCVYNIPNAISNSSFTLTRFERVASLSGKNVDLGLEWGKDWSNPSIKAGPIKQTAPVQQTALVQQAVAVKEKQTVQPVTSSIGPVTNTPNINMGYQCQQQGNKIVHFQGNDNACPVTYNPVISSGVVRFEGIFENANEFRIIGVADASVIYVANYGPRVQNPDKAVRFNGVGGELFHIHQDTCGQLNKFSNFQRVACEVNMNSSPRTAYFFVEGTEQPYCVYNIPNAIRFERVSSSSGKNFDKRLEWGKEWKNSAHQVSGNGNECLIQ
ncbi:MAG: hypothetical protein EZS28_021916 [Streblomastix strix]|uniref:Uncharacterized protein n=1 Tax=Streblomastix strix TaxID=222440 RepID=A0A5J4VIY0_9EUKA|nr:MAG: hypothetical protein EZS28_021916 [Streblomastix strix]